MSSSEVNDNFFGLTHVEEKIVITPLAQSAHLAFVVCLIVVGDEAHHSNVVCKLVDVVGTVTGYTIMAQPGEGKQAEHAPLWRPCA